MPDSQRSEFFCDPVAGGEADKACSVAPEGSQGSADHFADQASGVSELLDFSGGGIEPVQQQSAKMHWAKRRQELLKSITAMVSSLLLLTQVVP